jgi:hypothetical protein
MTMKIAAMLIMTATLAGVQAAAVVTPDPNFKETVTVEGKVRKGSGDHTLTFSGPVALPGVSLRPGTYVFRYPLENVVQVLDAGGKSYKMFITVPAVRQDAAEGYAIVLGPPSGPDAPRRIVAVFGPGEKTGRQFVYPAP